MNRINNNLINLYEKERFKTINELLINLQEREFTLKEILLKDIIPEHLQNLNKDKALLRILSYSELYSIMNIGYYNACTNNNPHEFLNSFFTYARLNFERIKMLGSGTDHCIFFPYVIEHLAMNDTKRAKEIFNIELGVSKLGHRYAKCVTTMIMAILHKDEQFTSKARIIGEKYLKLKNPTFDQKSIEFLFAIMDKNIEKVNDLFVDICKGYKNAKWLHDFKNPFLKEIGIYPIGLFKLAVYYFEEDSYKLVLPNFEILWKEFVQLKENGKSYIEFKNELKGLNEYLK